MKYILTIVLSCLITPFAVFAEKDLVEIEVKIIEHVFHPSVIDVEAGKKIRLIVSNEDDSVEEFESDDLHREKIIAPHSKIVITIAPLSPGEYKFFGEFHEETAQGVLKVQ